MFVKVSRTSPTNVHIPSASTLQCCSLPGIKSNATVIADWRRKLRLWKDKKWKSQLRKKQF